MDRGTKRGAAGAARPAKQAKTAKTARGTKQQAKPAAKVQVESDSEDEDELDLVSVRDGEDDSDAEVEDAEEAGDAESSENGDSASAADPNKKTSREQHSEQRQLLKERKAKRKSGLQVEQIKRLWEKLRVRNPPVAKDVRTKLVDEIWSLCQGLLGDLVLKHDASRVVQTLVKYADRETRDKICLELKPFYYKLATSAYGKYLLIKLLHYGSKEARANVIKALHGKLRKLMRHREGAYVVEDLFVLYSTSAQRQSMIREFWGAQYAFFNTDNTQTVVEAAAESAEKRKLIAQNLFGTIQASVEKGSTGFQILHAAMREYVQIFEGDEVRAFIELLAEQMAELVHTPQGADVACTLIAKATAKERKSILKALKPHAEAMAKNEHGQQVLQVIFMTVDDTTLVSKTFVAEYKDKLGIFMTDKFARRPFLYLLSGLSTAFFPPDVLKDLRRYVELSAETSKKPENDRRVQNLKPYIGEMFSILTESPEEMLKTSYGAQFVVELLLNKDVDDVAELRAPALDAIVGSVAVPIEEESLITLPHVGRFFRTLIQGGKWNRDAGKVDTVEDVELGYSFAVRFATAVFDMGANSEALAQWIASPDASFVVVGLLDQFKAAPKEAPSKKFISSIKKHAKLIKKQGEDNKGAKVLAGAI